MGALSCRAALLAAPTRARFGGSCACLAAIFSFATPASAETSEISPADTAWMIVATALVLMMTIPGLALFYSGMVRKKNVLATMAQSLAAEPLFQFSGWRSVIRLSSWATVPGLGRSIAGFSPA